MNSHEIALIIAVIVELLGVVFLAMFSFIRLQGTLRIFVVGLFIFLIADAVNYGAKQLATTNAAFDVNSYGIQLIIFVIQAIVLAFGAYFGTKLFVNYSYRLRDFFTIGAGAASLKLLISAKDHFSYLQILLGNYTVTEGGLTAEQYRLNADLLLQKPIGEFYIFLLESIFIAVIILLSAYLASGALGREEDSSVYIIIGAGVYVIFSAAYTALSLFVSIWLALVVGIAAVVGSILVLRSERE
ncbi:MAG TPA: hypothetical protein PK854_09395 [Oscillospiraceae bacterium]|nr:hypothetical protein [Oscillospiraceae bacterium]HPS35468.1 hypothetical protein [Oscillospiraceae bacterium]